MLTFERKGRGLSEGTADLIRLIISSVRPRPSRQGREASPLVPA
jgi:hypothetical protein